MSESKHVAPSDQVVEALVSYMGQHTHNALAATRTILGILRLHGYAVVPREATDGMFMRGSSTPVSDRGKDHLNPRPGRRIGDFAARDAYREMVEMGAIAAPANQPRVGEGGAT